MECFLMTDGAEEKTAVIFRYESELTEYSSGHSSRPYLIWKRQIIGFLSGCFMAIIFYLLHSSCHSEGGARRLGRVLTMT